MIRWFVNLIYGSISVEWESVYGLEESVSRLRAATKRSVFSALAEPAAVGTVTESRVKLQRVIPMFRNSFKPFLVGQFVKRGEHVFLVGRFTMDGFVKVFMTVWFGFLVVFGVAAPFAHTVSRSGSFAFVFAPIIMCGFGVGLVWFGKWLARNDAAWLADVVKRALGATAGSSDGAQAFPAATAPTVFAGRPVVVIVTAGVLGLMGAMNLAVVVSGMRSAGRDPFQFASMYSSGAFKYVAAAEGALLLAIAVGIFMRSRIAWMAGFLMIASAWAYSVASLFLMNDKMGPPLAVKIVFAGFGLLVTAYWGRWWHAQRVHFVSTGRAQGLGLGPGMS
jgi:hypothetical protein